jgi:hypothetical protein
VIMDAAPGAREPAAPTDNGRRTPAKKRKKKAVR